jgi:hypothetical protein
MQGVPSAVPALVFLLRSSLCTKIDQEATRLVKTVVRHDLGSGHLYRHMRSFFDTNALWVFL